MYQWLSLFTVGEQTKNIRYHAVLNGSKTLSNETEQALIIYYHAILNGSKTIPNLGTYTNLLYYHAILNSSKTSDSKTFIACLL
ncbi:hypothetical protein Si130_00552 [Streptococcus infantarius subsp. infantarius]|nr:hypothetical protein [Streptococcus infantarius subsp. infantarius]